MNSERWQLIERLFNDALDLPESERDEFLSASCGGDTDLLSRVKAMLAADESPNSLLEGGALDAVGLHSRDSWDGKTIGVFKIVRQIGVGGMGVVLLGERTEGDFQQQVAIKLVKSESSSEEIIRRFANERRILAKLNHPNIARLIGGGLTDNNVPYFTMEFVSGLPVDKYCDDHRLKLRERIRLLMTVCEAVSYAQQNLVIHRDLKPSNIFITDDGVVKLLDFGIAKLLDTDSEEYPHAGLTRTGMRIMTPGYASPEQVRGENLTTASDVFSLGVIMYELLVGVSPFRINTASPAEIERIMSTTQPRKPSSVLVDDFVTRSSTPSGVDSAAQIAEARSTDVKHLRRSLAGDLDNICMKALHVDVLRRYRTPQNLFDDLNSHLHGLPVSARPDTVLYRSSKFVERHKPLVVTTLCSLAFIIALVAFYTLSLRSQREQVLVERDKARVEARKAREVADFLTEMFSLADPNETQGRQITARELLDSGAVRLETELVSEPETKVSMLLLMSGIYYRLAIYDEAELLAARAVAISSSTNPVDSNNVSYAKMLVGLMKDMNGVFDSAEFYYREALAMQIQLTGVIDTMVAESQTSLAALLRHNGEFAEADTLYKLALSTRRELLGNDNVSVAHSLVHLGRLRQNLGDYSGAEPLLREAVDIYSKTLSPMHLESMAATSAFAGIWTRLGRLNEAESLYHQASRVTLQLVGEEHPYYGAQQSNLAEIAVRRGNYVLAESLFQECRQLYNRVFPENHPNLANPSSGLGRVKMLQGDPHAAKAHLEYALGIRKMALGDSHWQTAVAKQELADCLIALGENRNAEALLEQSLTTISEVFGNLDERSQVVIQSLISLYEAENRPDLVAKYNSLLQPGESDPLNE